MADTELVFRLSGSNARESDELANELQRLATTFSATTRREKENAETQDLGATIVMIFGSATAVALAKGIADWLRSHRQAKLEIRTKDGEVIVSGLTSEQASRLAEVIISKSNLK